MMKNRFITAFIHVIYIVYCILLMGCDNKPNISNVEINPVKIYRFDSVIKTLDTTNFKASLEACCDGYGVFIDGNLNDTNYIKTMQSFIYDTLNQRFMYDVERRFVSLNQTASELETMFRYMKYYFPTFKQPTVYSYISGGAITTPVLYNGNSLVISLDCFLGSDYYLYQRMGIPNYIAYGLTPQNIVKRSTESIINTFIEPIPTTTSVLEAMIYHGKLLYLMQLTLPEISEANILEYTDTQIEWCKTNEGQIWSTMVQGNVLFDRKYKTIRSYVAEAPFTKGLPQQSPGKVGQWIGLQIIKKYMNNSGCTIDELINEKDASKILSISKYKPRI